jgi:predicted esterase
MAKIFSKKYIYFWLTSIFLIFFLVVGIVIFLMLQAKQSKSKKEPPPLKMIIIQPTKKHSASVISLHGLGNNAENQRTICQPLAEKFPHIKFIIPQAPAIPVSMNGGWRMPAWYNIKGNPRDIMNLKEDEKGLLSSVSQIKKIIQQEVDSGISPQKIMVVGHSQGASVALAIGLTSDCRLAGIIGLSAFLPCRNKIFSWAKTENKTILFFLYHNYYDDVVPAWVGEESAKLLKEKGYQVEFEGEYSGNHFFQPDELQKILTEKLSALLS